MTRTIGTVDMTEAHEVLLDILDVIDTYVFMENIATDPRYALTMIDTIISRIATEEDEEDA